MLFYLFTFVTKAILEWLYDPENITDLLHATFYRF
jgi:hypothetical protein